MKVRYALPIRLSCLIVALTLTAFAVRFPSRGPIAAALFSIVLALEAFGTTYLLVSPLSIEQNSLLGRHIRIDALRFSGYGPMRVLIELTGSVDRQPASRLVRILLPFMLLSHNILTLLDELTKDNDNATKARRLYRFRPLVNVAALAAAGAISFVVVRKLLIS